MSIAEPLGTKAKKLTFPNKIFFSLTLILSLMLAATHAVAAAPTMQEAKKEAEAKGYAFFTTHDEIVAMAKKEGKLSVTCGMETANYKPLMNGFKQKYPFITDVNIEEITGTDAFQRFILEMKAGHAKGWDITHIPIDFAKEYMPYLKKHDIFGMANQGVIKIHPGMVHPIERNIVGVTSSLMVIPYNKKLISEDKVPAKWEDFLKPEFKGRKFVVDIRPQALASLVPAWGMEKTLDFARKLAAQQPVWGNIMSKVNAAIAAGENSLYIASNLHVVKRTMAKDPTGSLAYKIIEPIPTRNVDHSNGILNNAEHPYTALLWLEFLASPEGQEIIDKYEPLRASVFTHGSFSESESRGKKLSVIDWNHLNNFQGYQAKILEALGFPKAGN